jgi:hypothetical protein
MVPTFQSDGLETFLIARGTEECCMGPEVRIYHLMDVIMKPGQTVEYLPLHPYQLSGTLRFEPICEDGYWSGLYVLEDAIRRK